ncbi:MAG: hypothetical protein KJ622_07515 [Alphaproteobacteria bacterium]|nr:hypothetical protein [Alphaproteobacteria bacterium]
MATTIVPIANAIAIMDPNSPPGKPVCFLGTYNIFLPSVPEIMTARPALIGD